MLKEIVNQEPNSTSIQHLIHYKWKVAYDDMSLECSKGAKMADRVSRRQPVLYAADLRVVGRKESDDSNNNEEDDQARTVYSSQKKSQSVPPPSSRSSDCMDCPGMMVDQTKSQDAACSCPRKRKEPQDSLHEHERKFSRSSSLDLDKEDLKGSNMLLILNPQGILREPECTESHVLKEVQEHVQAKKINSEAEKPEPTVELKKRTKRRKRQRKESPQEFKENSSEQDFKENSPSQDNNNDSKEQNLEQAECKESKPEVPRKNALSFLFGDATAVARRSSSPLPATVSPQAYKRSASIGHVGEKQEETSQTDGCWVSERLAHIIRVETEKETMNLDTDSPRSMQLLDSERFMENNQHLDTKRKSEGDKPRVKQLTKQLSNLKRKIEAVEQQLREEQGYRPSHQDKLNNSQLKALLAEQNKLKQDLKNEKENNEDKERTRKYSSTTPTTDKCMQRIKAKRAEILRRLEEGRKNKGRPLSYNDMSIQQVLEEKLEMQSLLREYENEFGHPESREEKEVMKEVYERYRVIKRMARRSSQARSGDSFVGLMTIPEDKEVDLTTVSPQHRGCVPLSAHMTTIAALSRHDMDLPEFEHSSPDTAGSEEGEEADPSTGKLWHAMSREELLDKLRTVREDKKIARRAVKEFEDRFRNMTGRRMTKEDREPLEQTYKVYKNSKSKVKLINALLSKPNCGTAAGRNER